MGISCKLYNVRTALNYMNDSMELKVNVSCHRKIQIFNYKNLGQATTISGWHTQKVECECNGNFKLKFVHPNLDDRTGNRRPLAVSIIEISWVPRLEVENQLRPEKSVVNHLVVQVFLRAEIVRPKTRGRRVLRQNPHLHQPSRDDLGAEIT